MSDESKNKTTDQKPDELQTLSASDSAFWSWFRPGLAENWMRGVVGEYWVAKALELTDEIRRGWKSWDLETDNGIRIEVKTTGYRQSWHKPSDKTATPKFTVPKVRVKADENRDLMPGRYRPAHVYVFCFHKERDTVKLDPLDTSQWEFFVVPTKVLDENVDPNIKSPSINMRFLGELCVAPVKFAALKDAILAAANHT